jgi:hypothetical protein
MHFLAYVRQVAMAAPLIAVFGWAVTGIKWGALLIGGWMLMVMAIPIITNIRRIPQSRPAPPLPPLAGIADVGTVTLDTMTPRLKVILEGLIVVASGIAMVFLPRELAPGRRRLPGARHELVLVALTTMFIAYQFGIHAMVFFRLVRSIWLERHLAKRAMTGKGRIIESNSGAIKYEFLDYTSRLLRGAGGDYTMGLYEDMSLSVLYDPDDPTLNMPVVGLQFHRQRGAL